MAATGQTALSPRRVSPIGGARVAGAAGAAIVTPGGPLRSGAAVAVAEGDGVPRVRQAVVTAAAGRLLAAGEMGAGAGAGAGTTATAAEGRAAGRNESIGSVAVGAERKV